MARGFGSTYGVSATTDSVNTSYARVELNRSLFFWYVLHGLGAGGRFFQCGQTSPNVEYLQAGASVFNYNRGFTTTAGVFQITPPAFSTAWHSFGLSYNCSNTTNKPTIYVDRVAQTVTTSTAPVGTAASAASTVMGIGNATGAPVCGDVIIAEFAMWNCLLSVTEFNALGLGVRPSLIRPGNLACYFPLLGETKDLSPRKGGPVSLLGTKLQQQPPLVWGNNIGINSPEFLLPKRRSQMFVPTWATGSNRPVLGTGYF